MPSKVAFLTAEYPKMPTRNAYFSGALSRSLAQQGFQVEVVTAANTEVLPDSGMKNLEIHKVIQEKFLRDSAVLGQVFMSMRPQVVHLHLSQPLNPMQPASLLAQMVASTASQMAGAPLILSASEEVFKGVLSSKLVQPFLAQTKAAFLPYSILHGGLAVKPDETEIFNSSLYDVEMPHEDFFDTGFWDSSKQVLGIHCSLENRPDTLIEIIKSLRPLMESKPELVVLGLMSFDEGPSIYRHEVMRTVENTGLSSRFRFAGTTHFGNQRHLLRSISALIIAEENDPSVYLPPLFGAALSAHVPTALILKETAGNVSKRISKMRAMGITLGDVVPGLKQSSWTEQAQALGLWEGTQFFAMRVDRNLPDSLAAFWRQVPEQRERLQQSSNLWTLDDLTNKLSRCYSKYAR